MTILLLIITIILGLDFYIKHKILIKKYYRKLTRKGGVFHINKRTSWDKLIEDLNNS